MMRGYHSFVIRIDEQEANIYPVTAEFQGASWSGDIPVEMPLLTSGEMEQALDWLERGFIDRDYAKDFGSRLFQTLFSPPIREAFRTAYERVAPADGLRVILTLPSELADLPWELMYDEEGGHGFLARSATAPVVRHFIGMPLPFKRPEEGPLRVLIITSSPQGHPLLSSDKEVREISRGLARQRLSVRDTLRLVGRHLYRSRSLKGLGQRLRGRSLVEIDVLSNATRQDLQKRMVDARHAGRGYHVVHFIGHGYVDQGEGHVLLETEDGQADPVPAEEFVELIAEPTVNLAVFNACQTATAVSLFNGIAQATLRRGVPAVIGMQVPVLDRAAVEFAGEFYGAWAAGEPIEAALAYARRLVGHETPGAAADWGVPVLYMGPIEGLTLRLQAQPFHWPWPVLGMRRAVALFLSLLSTVTLLLGIFTINEQLRTEVPIVNCIWPIRMEEEFNVVVTEFPVFEADNSLARGDEDGRKLAVYLHDKLRAYFKELEAEGERIGEDLLGVDSYDIRVHYCPIQYNDKSERENKAAEMATDLNADVLIYGTIAHSDTDDEESRLSLEFEVNFEGFDEQEEEIVGPHALGSDLYIPRPFNPDKLRTQAAPKERVKALSRLVVGLSFYAKDEPDKALKYFQELEGIKGWSAVDRSKAIIYFLEGNANLRLATMTKNTKKLDDAGNAYANALEIDPAFARAKGGEAAVLFLKAVGFSDDPPRNSVDWELLYDAETAYKAALTYENAPETADIDTKIHYHLGLLYLVRAQELGDEWYPRAKNELKQVIEDYDAENARVEVWAGLAYAYLGLIDWRYDEDMNSAIDNITEAIDLVTPHSPYYEVEFTGWLAEAYADAGQKNQANSTYDKAIHLAGSRGFEEKAEELYQAQQALKAEKR